ncbi:MAG: type II toxin-antitoxin system death-on-curing family toxin [Synergistaceae bacterium]|nr:type II toxin-antitoxin system death-on-curing family toxin [Synergistaceae bacterium]MBQ6982217.1 type II toxin-antitoxin system death-on-curing family toxin [Synergistaceae bacterium]MBR0247699.1 type II toxin-antitoxin system death-on-curing family toxin [Synergistaceae bacterium]
MVVLSKEHIIALHKRLIERYGGIHGVRDEGLLDSALNAPFQSFGGIEFFPTVIEKAVRLCVGLIRNHPFHDGNKRVGAMVLLSTLKRNRIRLKTNNAELTSVMLDLAVKRIDVDFLLSWVKDRMVLD